MIISVNQPAYLAWLGYYERIAAVNLHVVLDHVQFEKNSFTNRNKLRTAAGWSWLTVPVLTKGRFGELAINSLEIDNRQDWQRKHWMSIVQNYGKAPCFATHKPFLEKLFATQHRYLAELCGALDTYLLDAFGISARLVSSTDLAPEASKDELVLELCRKLGATTYVSGALGRQYLREELFSAAGIRVVYQDYRHPEYRQWQGGPFQPYMAALDLLLNHGPDSLRIMTEGQAWRDGLKA